MDILTECLIDDHSSKSNIDWRKVIVTFKLLIQNTYYICCWCISIASSTLKKGAEYFIILDYGGFQKYGEIQGITRIFFQNEKGDLGGELGSPMKLICIFLTASHFAPQITLAIIGVIPKLPSIFGGPE